VAENDVNGNLVANNFVAMSAHFTQALKEANDFEAASGVTGNPVVACG